MIPEIKQVTTKREFKIFIKLPYSIHKDHPMWVPPLLMEERKFFNPQKNISFRNNEGIMFLAYQDKRPVGRIMGLINLKRNEGFHEKNARFGFMECYNDPDVAHALLTAVEEWARARGMTKIVGPMGFTDQDPEGLLIEGFEYEPTIATIYNFEYMQNLIEGCGYSKEMDYVCYIVDLRDVKLDFYEKVAKRVENRGEFEFLTFRKTKEMKPFVKPVLELLSETYIDLYGFAPLTDEEIEALGKQYLPVLDPRFVSMGRKEGRTIGFFVGMPNLNKGFRKARGHLFPFGLFYLLSAAKKSKQLDLLLGGIKQEYRGVGLDAWGMLRMIRTARESGFTVIDSHNEMEDNHAVRMEMERLGGKLCKRRRIFRKML
jgi:GNAT superfamily N-acetyltransferase